MATTGSIEDQGVRSGEPMEGQFLMFSAVFFAVTESPSPPFL
jgi:hypothetical protein